MNKVFSSIQNRRIARVNRVAAIDTATALSKVLSMSEEEKKKVVQQYIEERGMTGTMGLIKNFISQVRSSEKTAQMYQGKEQDQLVRPQDNPHNDQLKHKLRAGDWIDLLVFMILVGTAGSLDQGTIDILDSFLIATGSGFIAWAVRAVRQWATKSNGNI